MQEVFLHMLGEFDLDGETYLNVNSSAMIYMTVNAFMELNERTERLEAELEKQGQVIEMLSAKIEALGKNQWITPKE